MVADMMAEDEALLARKRTEIALIRAHFQSLYHELHPDQTCPVYENSLPILLAVRAYHDELKRLQAEHEQLLVQEGDIRKEERSLCNELNACSLQVDHEYFASKPLITQISLLSEHIQELKEEKVLSFNFIQSMRLQCVCVCLVGETYCASITNSSHFERFRRCLRMDKTESGDNGGPFIEFRLSKHYSISSDQRSD